MPIAECAPMLQFPPVATLGATLEKSPIVESLSRDDLYSKLKDQGIFSRRYFYPLISEFPMYRGLGSATQSNLPNAHWISKRILCIPIFPDIQIADLQRIVEIIKLPK